MAWMPVVEKLKEAIRRGDWAEAEIQVDILSKMDHPRDIFQNLTLNGKPALHHLANMFPRGSDIDRMNKVVKSLTHSGYDINQQRHRDSTWECGTRKFTALLAAVHACNHDIVASLLRHGARTDIRDAQDHYALHHAIFGRSRNIFDLLLDFGASVTWSEGERNGEEGKSHPLLHTAVDIGCPGMVAHMLRKGIFDVNEKAFYRADRPGSTDQTFSPLGRAIIQEGAEIFWNLLDQPGIRVELDELQLSLVKEDANMATTLMRHLKDISWAEVASGEGGDVQERVPSLLWILHKISSALTLPINYYLPNLVWPPTLATVMKLFVDQGYDLSLTWSANPKATSVNRKPLLHYVLRIDMICRRNLLLQTLVQSDRLQDLVPLTSGEGRDCLESLLATWNECCVAEGLSGCLRPGPLGVPMTYCVDTVQLLMSLGLNVSRVVIRKEFRYHSGYKSMIQLLYRNGVRLEDGYFSPFNLGNSRRVIPWDREWEIVHLEKWKQEFDKDKPISLKNICRLRIRKMLTGSEDLKMLNGLPVEMKEFVLRNDMG